MYGLDVDGFRAIHVGLHHAWLDPVFWALTWLGDGWTQTILVLLVLVHPSSRRLFWPLAVSFAVGGLLGAQGLKRLVPRDRPSNFPWAHPQEPLFGGNSFPSGHTTSSFAIAVMLILLTRGTRAAWTGWAALGLACLIGLSRIYRGVHWPSDVIGGALCGTFFACLIWLVMPRGE
ncbi:MAG TPA: phosphatase PAP2 family protein [Fimbriimonadaceae bacterium]|nr:phosphatase PAP2 family protein [Fimbriimonadaceae bacterium]